MLRLTLGFCTRLAVVLAILTAASPAWAGVDGSLVGTIVDHDGIALPNVNVQVLSMDGRPMANAVSSLTGEFQIFPLTFGDYQVKAEIPGYSFSSIVHVASGGTARIDIKLEQGNEMVVKVKAKRRLIQNSTSASSAEINKDQIAALPQGNEISLPKLLSSTTPGVVQGSFNQMYFRGNHANIQYQIDGVQLPDSPSGTFGEAFSPRNIDHMEVITGGIPAEYGQRLAAVLNIITKTGPETPGGEIEMNYGSYDTMSPHAMYGGSNESGSLHYFASANYHQTGRGLDTPQPGSDSDISHGGTEAQHDNASGQNEFLKLDWLARNDDKISLVVFNSENTFQVPNFPGSFSPNDPIFVNTDRWGNGPPVYTPSFTNDSQSEANAYLEVIWKHTFSERSFLQIAPYYRYSYLHFQNDPANDLFGGSGTTLNNPQAASFYEDRKVGNAGFKADYTLRPDDHQLVKVGTQLQQSRATGSVSVQTQLSQAPVADASPETGNYESLYVQDDYTITPRLVLNAGLRFDAIQFSFADASPNDSLVQPRLGLNYMVTDTTKVHVFYGKLFQPAPAEDLRDTFVSSGSNASQCAAGQLCPYDIKAEKDDYYEAGIAQQFLDRHVAMLNVYYKNATNMLDDTQLLNTAVSQPYNFAKGYAYGAEFSVKGDIGAHWSEYLNYSYEIAKGNGISGGIFAFPAGQQPPSTWQFLDHVQIHTANAGVTYKIGQMWWTVQGLYGSGLRTGVGNGLSLPDHLTFDTSVGYAFAGEDWWSKWKVSADVLNIFNNAYPITISNGYNGSHYAAGQEFFVHLIKEL